MPTSATTQRGLDSRDIACLSRYMVSVGPLLTRLEDPAGDIEVLGPRNAAARFSSVLRDWHALLAEAHADLLQYPRCRLDFDGDLILNGVSGLFVRQYLTCLQALAGHAGMTEVYPLALTFPGDDASYGYHPVEP